MQFLLWCVSAAGRSLFKSSDCTTNQPVWCPRHRVAWTLCLALCLFVHAGYALADSQNLLLRYVRTPDQSYAWKRIGDKDGFVELELTSQRWRAIPWTHSLLVFGQPDVPPDAPAFIFLTGGSTKSEDLEAIKQVAQRAHVIVALLTRVPNQPLFDGKKEDSLLAYSFDQFAKTGEADWPVLFPMVKSIVRAMDALTDFTHGSARRFVISGASKRGWISYLCAGVDARVVAIAPRVFEMINIRAQAEWQKKVYGKQSEKLRDFTDLGLVDRLFAEPKVAQLTRWIDPYEYRGSIKVPKLVLLGTNDPYWVVDSARWYWADLQGPKWLVQYPNLGHNLGASAIETIGSWAEYLGRKLEFPQLSWRLTRQGDKAEYRVSSSVAPDAAELWKACALTRDLREAPWVSEKVNVAPGNRIETYLAPPATGYCAYVIGAKFKAPSGTPFTLSTEAVVLPE